MLSSIGNTKVLMECTPSHTNWTLIFFANGTEAITIQHQVPLAVVYSMQFRAYQPPCSLEEMDITSSHPYFNLLWTESVWSILIESSSTVTHHFLSSKSQSQNLKHKIKHYLTCYNVLHALHVHSYPQAAIYFVLLLMPFFFKTLEYMSFQVVGCHSILSVICKQPCL